MGGPATELIPISMEEDVGTFGPLWAIFMSIVQIYGVYRLLKWILNMCRPAVPITAHEALSQAHGRLLIPPVWTGLCNMYIVATAERKFAPDIDGHVKYRDWSNLEDHTEWRHIMTLMKTVVTMYAHQVDVDKRLEDTVVHIMNTHTHITKNLDAYERVIVGMATVIALGSPSKHDDQTLITHLMLAIHIPRVQYHQNTSGTSYASSVDAVVWTLHCRFLELEAAVNANYDGFQPYTPPPAPATTTTTYSDSDSVPYEDSETERKGRVFPEPKTEDDIKALAAHASIRHAFRKGLVDAGEKFKAHMDDHHTNQEADSSEPTPPPPACEP
jgi:hypothetical protein